MIREDDAFRYRKVSWIGQDEWKRYAVLIPLVMVNGEVHILFEKRARKLRSQPSEVSFPGGRIECGEDPEKAAIRETMEELLISRGQLDVFGPMDRLLTPMGRLIIPFIGTIRDYQGTCSPAEVDYSFLVPYQWLSETKPIEYCNRIVQEVDDRIPFDRIPQGRGYPWESGTASLYFYHWEEEVIWGLTAKILRASIPEIERYHLLERVH